MSASEWARIVDERDEAFYHVGILYNMVLETSGGMDIPSDTLEFIRDNLEDEVV